MTETRQHEWSGGQVTGLERVEFERHVRTSAFVAAMTGIIASLWGVLAFFLGVKEILYLAIVAATAYFSAVVMHRYGWHTVARVWWIAAANLVVFTVTPLAGAQGRADFLLVCALAMPFVFFSLRREKVYIISLALLTFINGIALYLTDFRLLPSAVTPDVSARYFSPATTLSTYAIIVLILGYFANMTGRFQSEVMDALQTAQKASRAKSIFLANMSHEIRTPMNAVLGYSGLLREDDLLGDDQRRFADSIFRNGEHLLSLINDVLDLSRIEAGKAVLLPTSFNLRALLDEIRRMLELRIQQKGLSFAIEVESDVPATILVDESRIRQILINLIGNSIKFTAEGGINVLVRAARERIEIAVGDTGPGVPPESHELIFQAFEQSDSGREAGGGTGLGLAISRQFARLMQGDVTLESEPGLGSTFTFSFAYELGREDAIEAQTERKIVGLMPGTPEPRVLIVDDIHENREVAASILKNVGFAVDTAVNGREGIEKSRLFAPRIVLMDVRMPVMDGREATRILRAEPGGDSLTIIALSASVLPEEREDILQTGADAFIRKPFRGSQLLEEIGRLAGISYVYREAAGSAPPGARSAEDEEEPSDTHEVAPPGSTTVITIEDDPDVAAMIRSVLEKNEIEVLVFETGEQALPVLRMRNIDCVLLDLNLAKESGLDICKSIRAEETLAAVPIVFISADDSKETILRALQAGASDYLPKPFHGRELVARIESHVRLCQQQRAVEKKNRQLSHRNAQIQRYSRLLKQTKDRTERARQDLEVAQKNQAMELDLAATIQRHWMPLEPPAVSGAKIFSEYISLEKVGGDFIDYSVDPEGPFGLLLADSAGHGVPAALVSSMAKAAMDGLRQLRGRPRDVLVGLNASLLGKTRDHFVTACYAYFDPGSLILRYTCAGCPPPYLLRRGKPAVALKGRGMPLGILEEPKLGENETQLEPGDGILLVTDGILECRDRDGRELTERQLSDLLRGLSYFRMNEVLDRALTDLRRFMGDRGFEDDVTMILVSIEDPGDSGHDPARMAVQPVHVDGLLDRNGMGSTVPHKQDPQRRFVADAVLAAEHSSAESFG